MPTVDLRPFGIQRDVEIRGRIETSSLGGTRLAFLFGENHRDREMKRLNVIDACALVDAGVVGCAGTEVPMADLDRLTQAEIEARSRQLFDEHETDEAVIAYLDQQQPRWYGIFQFGSTFKILRPFLAVRCVEHPVLREEMNRISDAYTMWDLGAAPHPSPEHANMGDHPHNLRRENAMIDGLVALWNDTLPSLAAILNTGSDHSQRIAARLRERGISYFLIKQAASPLSFA